MALEHRRQPLLTRRRFFLRLARFASFAAGLVAICLLIGMAGYHWIAGLSGLDAFLNASMILTGMGPVDPMRTPAAKLFAALYALFSGVMFLTSMGVFAAPFLHRLLHRFHVESGD